MTGRSSIVRAAHWRCGNLPARSASDGRCPARRWRSGPVSRAIVFRFNVVFALLPVLIAAASVGPPEVEALLRQGEAAYLAGDVAGAIACFERAQRRATDPRLVAFNLATAYYHQARGGQLSALPEAEIAYRSCLERDDERRPQALLGLGNCLLLRGSGGKLDALALRGAIDRYTECLREPGADEPLRRDARYNQERARLLLAQAARPAGEAQESNAGEDENPKDPRDPLSPGERPRPGGPGASEPENGGQPGSAAREQAGDRGEGKPSAGRGSLPPVPDRADAPPLAAADAARHLDQASKRINEDLVRHRRGRARPATPGVRDW